MKKKFLLSLMFGSALLAGHEIDENIQNVEEFPSERSFGYLTSEEFGSIKRAMTENDLNPKKLETIIDLTNDVDDDVVNVEDVDDDDDIIQEKDIFNANNPLVKIAFMINARTETCINNMYYLYKFNLDNKSFTTRANSKKIVHFENDIIKFINKGINPHYVDDDGYPIIHSVISTGNLNVVKAFLDKYADSENLNANLHLIDVNNSKKGISTYNILSSLRHKGMRKISEIELLLNEKLPKKIYHTQKDDDVYYFHETPFEKKNH